MKFVGVGLNILPIRVLAAGAEKDTNPVPPVRLFVDCLLPYFAGAFLSVGISRIVATKMAALSNFLPEFSQSDRIEAVRHGYLFFQAEYIGSAAASLLILYFVRQFAGENIFRNGFRSVSWSVIGMAAAIGIAMFGIDALLDAICNAMNIHTDWVNPIELHGIFPLTERNALLALVQLFSVSLVAPLSEELFFRRMLMGWFSQVWSLRTAIIVSAMLFTFMHEYWTIKPHVIGILTSVSVFLTGVILAVLYRRYQSLWPAVVAHSAVNFCNSVANWIGP